MLLLFQSSCNTHFRSRQGCIFSWKFWIKWMKKKLLSNKSKIISLPIKGGGGNSYKYTPLGLDKLLPPFSISSGRVSNKSIVALKQYQKLNTLKTRKWSDKSSNARVTYGTQSNIYSRSQKGHNQTSFLKISFKRGHLHFSTITAQINKI